MGKPVNLNRVRKARARAEKRAEADENARRFGLNKAERAEARRLAERAARDLDGKKRE